MDARGNSNGNGREDRIPSDQEGQRLGRGRSGARSGSGGDPTMMAMPAGGGSELIGAETGAPADVDSTAPFRGWSEAAPLTNAPESCKFLRSIGPDGKLFDPRNEAVPTHRCAAFGDPLPLSLRQQELVCLQRVHVSCPRYMRGTLLAEDSASAAATAPASQGLPYLTLAGLALVAMAGLVLVGAMMGFLPGINPAGPGASPTNVALASGTPGPSLSVPPGVTPTPAATPTTGATPTPGATPAATPTPTPTPAATPTQAATPTPTRTPAATPTPTASPSWPPGATASRMKLLTPCQGQPNCYVYIVRGPGSGPNGNGSKVADQLSGVARFFGVTVAAVIELTPSAASGIHPGDQLKIPPPTR